MSRTKRGPDRRIQKTRNLLHEALSSLIREKPYETIVVKEILDRANVGRSTFYTHFRDKDELLTSGIRSLLKSAYPAQPQNSTNVPEAILRFSLPVFEHIYGHFHQGAQRLGSGGWAAVHRHLQHALTDLISEDIKRHPRRSRGAPRLIPVNLLVPYVASTFILVLTWWVESKASLKPREIDECFRSLVLPAVTANLEP